MVTNENVADAAVVGIKDEEAGELPKAFVVPKPGKTISPEELINWVHGKFPNLDIFLIFCICKYK